MIKLLVNALSVGRGQTKLFVIFSIIMYSFLLLGCSSSEKVKGLSTSITGYIVKNENTRLLVVSQRPYRDKDYETIWITSKDAANFTAGQLVEVQLKGQIQTSNPAQGLSEKISVIKMDAIPGAHKTKEDVLKEALSKLQNVEVPLVKDITFSNDNNKWTLTFSDSKNADQKVTIDITD
ncbi:DUF3221 domain-containing protein [Paenibacillus vulneris]|uniref:DUF3221 domain-containing protein n=1 Tax=Paenibacillus vulneris TaxID=1133364 RepID=A0ABW3UE88_9BACL